MKKTYINPEMLICNTIATSILESSPASEQVFSDQPASTDGSGNISMDAKSSFFDFDEE